MIPFLDLAADFAEAEAEARRRIDGVLARQQFVLGPETKELERALAHRLGARSAVAVSSGSDALSLALLALGVGPGHAVVLPAFTFFATAGAVVRAGAVPVFCDIEPRTFLAGEGEFRDAVARQFRRDGGAFVHRASGARLAALMPVHLYGRAAAMDGVSALAREVGAVVVEDAAQAIGARTGADGPFAGCVGDAGCLSFYPTKNLGGAGDGGMVLCGDEGLGERLSRLRTHGAAPGAYEHGEVGVNARLGELVAAVLNAKLAHLDAWTARRRDLARAYDAAFAAAEGEGLVARPPLGEEAANVWHQYALRIPGGADGPARDAVMRRAGEAGVSTRVFYPLPLHLQPALAHLGGKRGDLPACEAAAREVLCLPLFPSLDEESVRRVAEVVCAAAAAERR